MSFHHSQILATISPASISATANAPTDHSGAIFLAVICFVILIFFAGMAAHD